MKKAMVRTGLLSIMLLSACGAEEETYSKEEVEQLVNEAVAESNEVQQEKIEEVQEPDTSETTEEMIDSANENAVRGAYVKEKYLPTLMEQVVVSVTENGYKVYEMGSNVLHNELEISVSEFDVVKYLESDFTSNVFRSEEGKSYIIVYITGQNLGDRASSISDNVFINDLLITDANGETLSSSTDSNTHRQIASHYLEQFGTKQDVSTPIERLGYFTHVIGYEVKDEYLQPGNQLWLRQDSSWRYGGDKYKLPIYEIPSDFALPVVDEKYQ